MSSRRRLIREAVKEILKNSIPEVEDRVFTNISSPMWREDTPQIFIFSRSEDIEDLDTAPKEYKRTIEMAIEIVAEGPEDGEQDENFSEDDLTENVLDNIAEQVESLLEANETLGTFEPDPDRLGNACALVDEMALSGVEFEFVDGDKATGSARLVYSMSYYEFRPKNNRHQIGGTFEKLFATWNIEAGEGEPEAEDELDIPQN